MEHFSKMDCQSFLSLRKDVNPLIKKLASQVNYKKMGFTYEDILGFYEDKLIHLFFKYKEDPDIKFIVLKSLQNLQTKIYAQVPDNVIRIDDGDLEFIIPAKAKVKDEEQVIKLFVKFAKERLTRTEFTIFQLVTWPPLYIINKVNDISKRIPSHILLEFLGKEATKQNVKILNTLRKRVEFKIDILTQEFRPMVA